MKHKALKCISIIAVFLLVFAGLITVYVSDYYKAEPYVMESLLQSNIKKMKENYDIQVTYEKDRIVLEPKNAETGIIFYPGAKVSYEAYYPLLQELSKEGYLCVDCSMPARIALLHKDVAEDVKKDFPNIKHWYLAGHSLGGATAAMYLQEHIEEYDGILFFAAYSSVDLKSAKGLKVISVYGNRDEVLSHEKYEECKANVKDMKELVIDGGCHAYFGAYGEQKGDGSPTISRDDQIQQAVTYIVNEIEQ